MSEFQNANLNYWEKTWIAGKTTQLLDETTLNSQITFYKKQVAVSCVQLAPKNICKAS